MGDDKSIEPIRRSVLVETSREWAYKHFTEGMSAWWPAAYTWSGDVLETIAIEGGPGGRCYERGPHGFECDWGRVLTWDPPDRLVFSWQISPARVPVPDPARSSEVEVRFISEGPDATKVELEHRDFAGHGEGSDEYRAAMASEHGWATILERYAALVNGSDPGEEA